MITKGKIAICVLVIGIVILLFDIYKLNNLAEKYEKEIGLLSKKLAVLSNVRITLQQALKKSIRKKTEYKLSLQDEIRRREAMDEQVKKLFSEMATTKSTVTNLDIENYTLKNKVNQLEKEKSFFSEQIASFKKIQNHFQLKIRRLLARSSIELGQLVVTPVNISGKIIKANRAYNFVIIDLGENNGIKPGMTLMAYRQDAPIGEVIIEKVYNGLSVGRAAFEWRGNELGVGDVVKGKE